MATREEQIRTMAASHKGYKSRLTFSLNTTERTIDTARTSAPSQHMLDELKENRKKMYEAFSKVEVSIRDMQAVDTDDKFDGYETKLKTEYERTMKFVAAMDRLIVDLEQALKPKTPKPAAAAAAAPGGALPKPNNALKPKELTREHSPIEFTNWIEQFSAYFTSSRMINSSILEQQAYFKNCIGAYLISRINAKIQPNTPVLPDPAGTDISCIELLKEEFLVQYPLFTRRLDFFQYKQSQGQQFTDWETTLRKKGDEADLASLTVDDLYVMRYLTGISDTKLQIEFLKESAPDTKKLAEIAQTYEMAKRYVKAMGPTSNFNQPHKDKKKQGSSKNTSSAPSQNLARQLAGEGKCLRCGKQKKDNHACKAENLECKNCGKTGHFPSVCFSKAKSNSNNASTSNSNTQKKAKKKPKAKANSTKKAKQQKQESSDSDSSDDEAVTNTVKT